MEPKGNDHRRRCDKAALNTGLSSRPRLPGQMSSLRSLAKLDLAVTIRKEGRCHFEILSDGAPRQEPGGFRSVQLTAACPIVLIPSLLHPSALSRQASCRLP
jgi:hypothetical protein